MSSFDYTDNFNGFNDLINRADFLTEMADSAKKAISQLAKTKDGKVGLNDLVKMYQHKTKGTSPAASYAKNMLWLVAMAEQDFITDEQKEFIKRTTNMGSSTAFAKAVKDAAPDPYDALYGEEQKSEDLIKFVGDNSIVLLRRAIMNMPGDKFIYVGPDVEDKELDAAVSSQKVEDDIEDTVGQLDAAESELAQSLEISKADPTTFIEIKIRDAERVEDVGSIVSKYANEDGLDISNDTVQFSVDPDTPLANAVSTHGIDKIEAALKRDVDKISDSVVVVMAPDEDYEQIDDDEQEGPSLANSPGGAPSSYAAGEEGGGLTTPEDAEDEWNEWENKRESARDRAREAEDKGDWDEWNKQENEREEARDRAREDAEDEFDGLELDHFLTKEQPEDYIPSTDYEDVIIDKEKNSTWGHGGVVDQLENVLAIYKNRLIELPPGHPDEDSFEEIIKKANRLRESILVWDKLPPDAPERLAKTNPPFLAGMFLNKLKEEDQEEFNYSPMLDSYKTSTAGYLTEQTASDKRNKKTEVKKETFKEKYKPKTHWQLEELRRYGL